MQEKSGFSFSRAWEHNYKSCELGGKINGGMTMSKKNREREKPNWDWDDEMMKLEQRICLINLIIFWFIFQFIIKFLIFLIKLIWSFYNTTRRSHTISMVYIIFCSFCFSQDIFFHFHESYLPQEVCLWLLFFICCRNFLDLFYFLFYFLLFFNGTQF